MLSYFLKKRLKKHDNLNNVAIKSLIQAALLQQSALSSNEPGIGNNKPHNIVVSLTSFGLRIEDVYLCIESLFSQSLKADHIVLWLSRENFPDERLPELLHKQQQRGLTINFVDEDFGPYKKYVYSFKQFPDSLIITVDDDILYPVEMIDMLYRGYLKAPQHIYCHRGHRIVTNGKGGVKPYHAWEFGHVDSNPSLLTFPTGMGGVLYPPGSLHDDAFNAERFLALSPRADDIWLKAMSLKQGTKCVKIADPRPWKERFLIIPGPKQAALSRENRRSKGGNDDKIKATFSAYNLYERLQD
ncbi:hypothetical protein [Halioxenophilus sp. WMMB6]|uniref:hypothetical protein n=1 Tax=Halioxenophilus sp. WMMB6 TaxID=3073815 RepID=UPI00295E5917|nr:hypothetical protein [Halioxenophilus sp. WMMB6]